MPPSPWLAHCYTALGAPLALWALLAAIDRDFRTSFLLLAVTVLIDATDGWLARWLRVKERLPYFDGARLDDIIDYLTYVVVPVVIAIRVPLLPEAWAMPVGTVVLLSSAYGFSRTDAKVETTDFFFTGFPSYWNIVVLYLFLLGLPAAVNAAVLVTLAALVFAPMRYIYPSRTRALRRTTLALSALWGAAMFWMLWRLPEVNRGLVWISLAAPAYYVAISLWLAGREPR
ncbi:MAG: CDP-diacylglycerol O-phosphatidyltransferase [Acidobacteria bacterium]|nr:CDP-diacylglycerol O-phosphatidyltransferase [Acidobacteriota bacterium]